MSHENPIDGPEPIFATITGDTANFTIDFDKIEVVDANNEVRSLSEMYYETPDFTDPDYKFGEGPIIEEIKEYIDSTYNSHYAKHSKYQATDMIIDAGHGEGFCIGNVMKYAKRYGTKGGYKKSDLLKIVHYAIIMIHLHDKLKLEGKDKHSEGKD